MSLYSRSLFLPLIAKSRKYWRKRIIFIGCSLILIAYMNNSVIIFNDQLEQSIELPEFFSQEHSNTLSLSSNSNQAKPHLTNYNISYWDTVTVSKGDSLSSIFSKLNLPYARLHDLLKQKSIKASLSKIRPGQQLHFRISDECKVDDSQTCDLEEVKLLLSDSKVLHIERLEDEYKHYTRPLDSQIAYAEGEITDSLYMAAARAKLDDDVIIRLTQIFGWDIDFALDIRQGDSFKVIYEENYLDGKKVGNGDIVAAEFINRGEVYQAVRFIEDNGDIKYYTPEGESLQKAFIRTPVKFTRISSRFTTGRYHPILHKIRAHKGVDYAAPTGTPVKASGDGKVIFRGVKSGYGNIVIIQHGPKYTTAYAHLSRFNRKARHGSTVKQGQIIGYVGMTGLATAPHLHYEFRVNGVHRDPLKVKLPDAKPIKGKHKQQFIAHAKTMLNLLDMHDRVHMAKLDG